MTGPPSGRAWRAFHCQPKFEAGARMPSANTIALADHLTRKAAELGSAALLAAYDRYFEKLHRERMG